jgi:hypothetical protein
MSNKLNEFLEILKGCIFNLYCIRETCHEWTSTVLKEFFIIREFLDFRRLIINIISLQNKQNACGICGLLHYQKCVLPNLRGACLYIVQHTDKKKILTYKEIQMGSGAKSYMRKGFLIYEEMRKFFRIQYMRSALVTYDFASDPS